MATWFTGHLPSLGSPDGICPSPCRLGRGRELLPTSSQSETRGQDRCWLYSFFVGGALASANSPSLGKSRIPLENHHFYSLNTDR